MFNEDEILDEIFENDDFLELCGYSIGLAEAEISLNLEEAGLSEDDYSKLLSDALEESSESPATSLIIVRMDLQDQNGDFHSFGLDKDMAVSLFEHFKAVLEEASWI